MNLPVREAELYKAQTTKEREFVPPTFRSTRSAAIPG